MHHHVRACTCLLLYLEESMVVISGVEKGTEEHSRDSCS